MRPSDVNKNQNKRIGFGICFFGIFAEQPNFPNRHETDHKSDGGCYLFVVSGRDTSSRRSSWYAPSHSQGQMPPIQKKGTPQTTGRQRCSQGERLTPTGRTTKKATSVRKGRRQTRSLHELFHSQQVLHHTRLASKASKSNPANKIKPGTLPSHRGTYSSRWTCSFQTPYQPSTEQGPSWLLAPLHQLFPAVQGPRLSCTPAQAERVRKEAVWDVKQYGPNSRSNGKQSKSCK